MYGALKSVGLRLPNVGLSSFQCCLTERLIARAVSQRTFAIRTDFSETVYDNEDGGPKCRGIELLRDPNFNKVNNAVTVATVDGGGAYLSYPLSQKKQETLILPITLPNIDRFSKFFHQVTQQ